MGENKYRDLKVTAPPLYHLPSCRVVSRTTVLGNSKHTQNLQSRQPDGFNGYKLKREKDTRLGITNRLRAWNVRGLGLKEEQQNRTETTKYQYRRHNRKKEKTKRNKKT